MLAIAMVPRKDSASRMFIGNFHYITTNMSTPMVSWRSFAWALLHAKDSKDLH